MSVFAVPRSIARSREKSLNSPLNMERSEPWGRVSEARDASKEGQVTQPARARGYARVPLWCSKGLITRCRRPWHPARRSSADGEGPDPLRHRHRPLRAYLGELEYVGLAGNAGRRRTGRCAASARRGSMLREGRRSASVTIE